MRRRAIQMTSLAVAVAVLFLGIPAIIFGVNSAWHEFEQTFALRARSIARVIERREIEGIPIQSSTLAGHAWYNDRISLQIIYTDAEGNGIQVGAPPPQAEKTFSTILSTKKGSTVEVSMDRRPLTYRIVRLVLVMAGLILLAFGVGVLVALRQSRRLSAPLIYLAASAEQVGAGQVRPQIKPSGIEEIDLVTQELERTADRIAARIAAERQFAAAAAHQLRTPLTALSMRIEEIQYLTQDPEISEEVEKALEQIERLGGVINELMNNKVTSRTGHTEVVSVDDIFHQQQDEWRRLFQKEDRKLLFSIQTDSVMIATPGSISQIVATLIENSLKYGAGTTYVSAEKQASMVVIRVRDEGAGVSSEIAPLIFERGISTGGSTGIGLSVAKELAEVNGGRLELTKQIPAEFSLTMKAMPASLAPHLLVPQGASYTVGARRRRR